MKLHDKLLLVSISLYQKYIAPHKGFCCAHSALTGEMSCSAFVKQQIKTAGLFASIKTIKHRFKRCKMAAQTIQNQKNRKKMKKQIQMPVNLA